MLNVYELTIFMLLCSKKDKRKVDQRTLVLASLSKNKYISKERTKRRRQHLFPGNAMSLPRKRRKKKKKTHYELTTMLLVNDHYRLMANLDDRNYMQPLHVHCQNQSRKNYYHLNLNHHHHHHYSIHLLMNNHHHQTNQIFKRNFIFYLLDKILTLLAY